MRQSLIRRKPTKRCRQKKKNVKLSLITNSKSKHKNLHRFTSLLHNAPPQRATVILRHNKLPLTICRGWRPRQPTPLTFRIIVYLTTLDNPTNIGRGEQRSPVLRTCRNFRIVGAGALDSPFGGGNAVIGMSLMYNYSGCIAVIFSNNSTGEKYRDAEGVVPYTFHLC